tara:strand:+ start:2626 stop:2970 length:345 start_codon:yes stop_codon:yes gene_type:complete
MGGLVVSDEIREFSKTEMFEMFKVIISTDENGNHRYYKYTGDKVEKVRYRENRVRVLNITRHNGKSQFSISIHSEKLKGDVPNRSKLDHDAIVIRMAEFYQNPENDGKSYFDEE